MQEPCVSRPDKGWGVGRLVPISWRQPFLLSPTALQVFFLLYAVNCIVLYQDRIVFDITQFLNSSLLAKNIFFVCHGRGFIQVPPQILPWLAILAGLPMKWVALGYSLGFCVYHYLMTMLLYYGFRRRDLATLLVLVIVIHLVHNNFYIYADGMHIVPWALCMLAVLQYPAQRLPGRILVVFGSALFALITASSHLFGLPLSLALGGYAFFQSDRRRQLLPALITITVVLGIFYVWQKTNMDLYDRSAIQMIGLETLRENGLYFVKYFVFAHAYVLGGVVLLVVLGFVYARHRCAYWFSALCVLGYAVLIASYLPRFIHLYYWHCLIPMYAILGAPFFDAEGNTPATRVFSRFLFVIAIAWMIIGSIADLTAIRARSAFQNHIVDALPADKDGNRFYILEGKQLSSDLFSSVLSQFISEETSLRAAYADPAKATIIMERERYEKGNWMFDEKGGPSSHLSWLPLDKSAFIPAVVPTPREEIQRRAAQITLDYPERPTSMRIIDGWLVNYQRPPRLVYTVPVTITNRGDKPFPAGETNGKAILFGYYWHLDGKIVYEDLRAECLPIDVKSTFQHVLNVKRSRIPSGARLTIDLFLNGCPLLHPELYYSLVSSKQHFSKQQLFGNVITAQTGFYPEEGSHVWMARQASFVFNSDLARCSFALVPSPGVDANNPADIEVRCEATGVLAKHQATDRTPFTITVNAPKKGQTLTITSTRDFCPASKGGSDTRSLALMLYNVQVVSQ